jgi:hypothetical protein
MVNFSVGPIGTKGKSKELAALPQGSSAAMMRA